MLHRADFVSGSIEYAAASNGARSKVLAVVSTTAYTASQARSRFFRSRGGAYALIVWTREITPTRAALGIRPHRVAGETKPEAILAVSTAP